MQNRINQVSKQLFRILLASRNKVSGYKFSALFLFNFKSLFKIDPEEKINNCGGAGSRTPVRN